MSATVSAGVESRLVERVLDTVRQSLPEAVSDVVAKSKQLSDEHDRLQQELRNNQVVIVIIYAN